MLARIKKTKNVVELGRPWLPGHARFLRRQLTGDPAGSIASDEAHLRATAAWIATAQDSQTDGGVSGRYKLASGWSSSYPETTGYLVPTMLALAERLGEPAWRERAARAVEFLLALQLPEGGFPGGEVAENRDAASPFNTAQILNGLNAWAKAADDSAAERAAERAAAWLIGVQDADGAFRKHYYYGHPTTYSAHLSCWIAEHGRQHDDAAALAAAGRHLDWVLGHQDRETGWFDGAGFDADEHAARNSVTHTIAYTIWGVLFSGVMLGRPDAIAAARQAADGVLRRLELTKTLPGWLDAAWKPVKRPQCLTGNAQMALIWLKLNEIEPEPRYVNAALKAIDQVKMAQDVDNPNPALRGIAGSFPVWGDYIPMALPNWAAKFFVDALIEKGRALQILEKQAA